MPDMPKNISSGLTSTDGSNSSQAIKEDVEANMQLANSIAFVQECLAGAATTAGELGTAYKATGANYVYIYEKTQNARTSVLILLQDEKHTKKDIRFAIDNGRPNWYSDYTNLM